MVRDTQIGGLLVTSCMGRWLDPKTSNGIQKLLRTLGQL